MRLAAENFERCWTSLLVGESIRLAAIAPDLAIPARRHQARQLGTLHLLQEVEVQMDEDSGSKGTFSDQNSQFGKNRACSISNSDAGAQSTYFWATGMRRPRPKAREVTLNPGAACSRLYSFKSTRRWTQRTVFSSSPRAMMSRALKFSST